MKRTPWFERVFPPITDNGVFPSILERLEGTHARLWYKIKHLQGSPAQVQPDQWSIHKEVGHLIDLEKSAVHPRLGTPMKLIDLAFFVAEHDDHHLAQITSLGGAVKYK